MMSSKPEISVVLPVYNQADHIEKIVRGYLAVFESLRHPTEFILVVNGNRDGSLEHCRRLEKDAPGVIAIHNEKPGWGLAVRTGLNAAKGQILCYTNSARTSPHILAMHIMLATANPGWVIKANRKLRHPFVRKFGSVLYNLQCRYLFDLPAWDVNGTPKVFSREQFAKLGLEEDGDLVDVEFIVKCRDNGFRILEAPIVSPIRHGNASTTNYGSAVKMYWGAFRLWRRLNHGPDGRSARDGE